MLRSVGVQVHYWIQKQVLFHCERMILTILPTEWQLRYCSAVGQYMKYSVLICIHLAACFYSGADFSMIA